MKLKYIGSDCQYPAPAGLVKHGAVIDATPEFMQAVSKWKHEFVPVDEPVIVDPQLGEVIQPKAEETPLTDTVAPESFKALRKGRRSKG